MEQESKVDFSQRQNYGENKFHEGIYIQFCLQDILKKLTCKADELTSSGYSVLQNTKSLMREALDLLCFFNSNFNEDLRSIYSGLDEWHKNCIVNWGTSEYLKEWLKHDHSTYRNIHEFFKYRFDEKNKRDVITEDYQKFWKSVHCVYARRMDVTLQAKKAGILYSSELLKQIGEPENIRKTEKNAPIYFDLLLLWESEKRYSVLSGKKDDPDLEILSLLVERKSRCKNDILIEAYKKYYQLFQSITPGYSKNLNDVEYVVTSMQLHEIEYIYQFHLCAKLAQSRAKKGKSSHFPREYTALWHPRISDYNVPIAPKSGNKILPFYPFDIVHYPEEIDFAYNHVYEIDGHAHGLSSEITNHLTQIELQKSLTRHMILLVAMVKSPRKAFPAWTANDFKEIRKFYEKDMEIYRVWEQNPFINDTHSSGKAEVEEIMAKYIWEEWKLSAESFTTKDPAYQEAPVARLFPPHQEMLKKERNRLRYQRSPKTK